MGERLCAHIVDALPVALLVLDGGLRVILSNRACGALLAKQDAGLVGLKLRDVLRHQDVCRQANAVLRNGGRRVVELYDDDSGVPKVLRAEVTALEGDGFGLSGRHCLVMLEDISQRVRLEEQLVQSEKLAGMGLLASSVAHELGNPLAIMTSTLDQVRKALLRSGNDALTESIETIRDSIDRMHDLLRSLTQFTRPRRPAYEIADLSQIVSQMLKFVCAEAEQHHIKIHREFDGSSFASLVDPGEIKEVLLNLLKNAIEAMPNGGTLCVRLGLAQTDLPEAENQVRIEISDNGVGMTESEIGSIFRTFYTTKPGNTGLGLPYCRRVVEEHGGEITVSSRPGQGSTFVVSLPAHPGDEP